MIVILSRFNEGKFLVWKDDGNGEFTAACLEKNMVKFTDSYEEAAQLVQKLQQEERAQKGRAETRYHVSGRGCDDVFFEDFAQEEADKIIRETEHAWKR